jgi:uncharacterized protein YbjT (DUF2867 family)
VSVKATGAGRIGEKMIAGEGKVRKDGCMRVAVIGASGYIGSHLVPRLIEAGHEVVACSRNRDVLDGRQWQGAETAAVDLLKPETLAPALAGCDAAYYLVHSMGGGKGFAQRDRRAAANLAEAAGEAGLKRIIYLGGLVPKGRISPHLRSRAETGDVLRRGSVPVTELQASIIVGAGSAGFEIIRDLVNNLPAMIVPRWVQSRTAPIALEDVLAYLVRCLDEEETTGDTFEISGPEVLQYGDLLAQYGEMVGKRTWMLPVPVLTPRLSSYWLDLVTSVPANVARPLVEGLREDLLPTDRRIESIIPIALHTYREAVTAALDAERADALPARWVEGAMRFRGYRQDVSYYSKGESTVTPAAVSADALWGTLSTIGGKRGWFYADRLWSLRGAMDRAIGGPGMRRGRRHPVDIRVGDALDFWRVVAIEPGKRLTLMAEMRLPGEAVLEFEVRDEGEERSTLVTTARFHPRGVLGLLYWYAVTPLHGLIFTGMPRSIVRVAESATR